MPKLRQTCEGQCPHCKVCTNLDAHDAIMSSMLERNNRTMLKNLGIVVDCVRETEGGGESKTDGRGSSSGGGGAGAARGGGDTFAN